MQWFTSAHQRGCKFFFALFFYYIYDSVLCCIGISWDPVKEEIVAGNTLEQCTEDHCKDKCNDKNDDKDGDDDEDANDDDYDNDNGDNNGNSDEEEEEENNNIAKLFRNANYKYDPRDPAALRFSHLPISISARYNFIKAERIQACQLDGWKEAMTQAASRISSILSTTTLTDSRSKKAMKQMQQELQHYVGPWLLFKKFLHTLISFVR